MAPASAGAILKEELILGGFFNHETYNDGISEIIAISKPPNENEKFNFINRLQEDDVDTDKSYLTLWDEKNQKIISAFGSLPPSYDESDFDKE